jgi:hypothetical protein
MLLVSMVIGTRPGRCMGVANAGVLEYPRVPGRPGQD